jgi:hypothetical protein
MTQFSKNDAAVHMNRLRDAGEGGDMRVPVQSELQGLILTAGLDVDVTGYDEARTAGSEIPIQRHQGLGGEAIRRCHRFGGGRSDQAVFERQSADMAGLKKRQFMGHG